MPKFTTPQIKAEISALEQSGAQAAVYYLQRELNRRSASKMNAGAPLKDRTEQRERWRRNSENYRKGKSKPESVTYDPLDNIP